MESAKSASGLFFGSVMMVKCFFSEVTPALLERSLGSQGLQQGLGGAAGLGNADEVRLGDVEFFFHSLKHAPPALGVNIVMEFDEGALGGFCG